MQVLLMRHAPALARDPAQWPDDCDRPLSERGRRRAAQASRGVARLASDLDAIWSSPAARALQTAEILRNIHPRRPPLRTLAELAPTARVAQLVELIMAVRDAETVALVGHEPSLARVAAALLGAPRAHLALPLKKAGAACFIVTPGETTTLLWWLPARLLRCIT